MEFCYFTLLLLSFGFSVLENAGYDRSHLYKHILSPVQDQKGRQQKKKMKIASNMTRRDTIK